MRLRTTVTMIYTDLARKLFTHIFQKQFSENPDNVYCTEVDGKQRLNQEYLKGICCMILFYIYDVGKNSSFTDHVHYWYFHPLEDRPTGPHEVKRWRIIRYMRRYVIPNRSLTLCLS